jgi:uncharacterized protein (DUF488 family)
MTENILSVWTIGHSTRSEPEFLDLLRANGIQLLADVRRFPASRKYPHFNGTHLHERLPSSGIAYEAVPELGGRRRPLPDSLNSVWRNESFRGYADYMETPDFEAGIARLTDMARTSRTAIMCSEAVWWRCHRALIADYLKAKSAIVIHIIGNHKNEIHPFTSAARLEDGRLSYHAPSGMSGNEVGQERSGGMVS